MFKVGDKVVHPMHGAGVIDRIVEEKVGGVNQKYYVFTMPMGGLVLKIPVEKSDRIGLRAVVDGSYAEKVFDAVSELQVDSTSSWTHRYRENMERLKSGDLFEVARVIKGLTLRDAQRGLSTGERKMLHNAKHIFISEMVLAQGDSYHAIEGRLNSCITVKSS